MSVKIIAWSLLASSALCLSCSGDDDDDVKGYECGIKGGIVDSVIDGDTIKLKTSCTEDKDCCLNGDDCSACGADGYCAKLQTVRFMGINAGEIPHGKQDDAEHCLGQEAKEALEGLILGKEVSLVFDEVSGCNEKYGRWLAYVFYNGNLLQERLVSNGYACLYWYTNEPNRQSTLYYNDLISALETAKAEGNGIYSPDGSICKGFPKQPNCNDD